MSRPSRMLITPWRAVLLVAVAATLTAVPNRAEPLPARLLSLPGVQAAVHDADLSLDSFVQEWIRIAEIPAPSGREGRRADYLEGRFRQLGLHPVWRDQAGNVIGLMQGRDQTLKRVAFLAHMDTVAPEEANHTVRRLPGRLSAPGVRDDSSGLAALLAAVELMKRHALTPEADTLMVASASEEVGLVGAERFVADHGEQVGALVAVDGHLGQISYGATGIVWLKLHFRAGGAHTLKAHERPSAVLAAARAIERIHAVPLHRTPERLETWLNVGMLGGGEVPNAQARDAWFTVDLRSNDSGSLQELETKVLEIGRESARDVGVEFDPETMHRMAGTSRPGMEDSALVRSARTVLEALAWDRVDLTPRGTADHNAALAKGIPAIAIGVTTGDGAHTPEEYADIAPFPTGVKQILLLALMPLTDRES